MKQLARVFNRKPLYRKKSAVDWPLPDQLVGLEVEAENIRGIQVWPNEEAFRMYWKRVSDGSLQRGNEYVLTAPLSGNMLGGAIQSFFSTGKLVRDPAGSTHIHLNMMDEDDTVDGLRNLCILMYLFEELLFVVGDPGRAACGYTNRLITAPERFLRTIFSPELDEKPQLLSHVFSSDGSNRYYGFNMQALGKHGTVEFRYFPTATNAEELINWVKLLMSFKKAALSLNNVAGIERVLSSENDYLAFVNENFGTWYEQFLSTTPYAQARRTMDTIRAMNSGISQPQDANVSVDRLRKSARFSKFFTRLKKELVPEPVVRPDKIHCILRGEPLPEKAADFDGTLKHIMLHDHSIYIWHHLTSGWVPIDGYGMYHRITGSNFSNGIDDYVTWDDELITILKQAVDDRRASTTMTHRVYESAMLTIREFADWIVNIRSFYKNGGKVSKVKRDGVYRLQHTQLPALWSMPEDPHAFNITATQVEDDEEYEDDDAEPYDSDDEPYEEPDEIPALTSDREIRADQSQWITSTFTPASSPSIWIDEMARVPTPTNNEEGAF